MKKAVLIHYPCPSVPIRSTDAENVAESLDTCTQIKAFQSVGDEILQSATVLGCEIDSFDGAFSNLIYEDWKTEGGAEATKILSKCWRRFTCSPEMC